MVAQVKAASGPVRVRMNMAVTTGLNGGGPAKDSVHRMDDRIEAARWVLLGWADAVDTLTPEELQAAAPLALKRLDEERRGRGFEREEAWLAIPNVRKRYERLFALLDGAAPEGSAA